MKLDNMPRDDDPPTYQEATGWFDKPRVKETVLNYRNEEDSNYLSGLCFLWFIIIPISLLLIGE